MKNKPLLMAMLLSLLIVFTTSSLGQKKPVPVAAPRMIDVPVALADEYKKAIDAETQAYNQAIQTPAYKDYQIMQQQRLRIENYIAGELGCKPSQSKFIRDTAGNIVWNKEGRIEKIECNDSKE